MKPVKRRELVRQVRQAYQQPSMMGQQLRTQSLFYYFRLEDQIPEDHLLRVIGRHVNLSFVRERLRSFYSSTGRPSIDPEVLLRLLLVGYLYGITSERRLLEEVKMHLAHRWFTRLGFEQEIPDHSTFSKNRHGRFRQCGVFRKVFEEIVRRCLEAGLVEGRNLAVDGTLVGANASNQSRVPREKLVEVAQNSRTVQEYLAELERQNPVADPEERPTAQKMVSSTDPDAAWAVKSGPATLGYYDNYLVDTTSRVILSVNATPARFRQEVLAARWMLELLGQFGVRPQNLAADKAYGSGEFLAWLLEQNIQPHIPVIDRRHQTQGHFTREQFRYEPKENAYYCPEGKALLSRSIAQQSGLSVLLDRSAMSRVSAEEIYVPRVSIEKYLFIGRSQRDKQFARWQVRLNISTLNERGTRSRPCSRSQAVATTQHRVTDVGRRQSPKTQGLEEAPQALQENSRRAASRFRPPQFSTDSHKFIGGLVSHEN